jgi:3-deoxy-manno-octulosonate cytidylyltransferase (CMP-KDO synthetase)
MKISALIPARYDSIRFPGKLMKKLGRKSVIRQTYESVLNSKLFDEICVITDSKLIYNHLNKINFNVLYSNTQHECGTDRIAEMSHKFNSDIIFNIQGDEPFIDKNGLIELINVFKNDINNKIQIASLMTPILDYKEVSNPNIVKVIVDKENFAIYFSRHSIPYSQERKISFNHFKHIGVYALRRKSLKNFSKEGKTTLESIEKIEAIRFLEMGYRIKMIKTNKTTIGIDTIEDLEKANDLLKRKII